MQKDIKVDFINKNTVHFVNEVVQAVYGQHYEKLHLPDDIERLKAHTAGDNIIALAFAGEKAVGMVSLKRSFFNVNVYEVGMLSVIPSYRNSIVATALVKYVKSDFSKLVDFEAAFFENVSSHYYTQRKAYYGGCIDSAILLSTMPELNAEKERLSFIMAFLENIKSVAKPIYIPSAYADILAGFYYGLKSRQFMPACYTKPENVATVSKENLYPTIGLLKETFFVIGSDFSNKIENLESHLLDDEFFTIQVYLSLNSPFISFAVDCLRAKGYFIGGVLPFWFGADGLVMQKSTKINWQNLCLYSKKSRYLFDVVYEDYLSLYN